MDLTELYQTQISLTEWLEKTNHPLTEKIRQEDNVKRERLGELNQLIGIPFDKPVTFSATDIAENTPAFQAYLREHGHELCALRLIPKEKGLPKLRMRGDSVQNVLKWFGEQKIDPSKYQADFVPHSNEQKWSSIFVVNRHGIFGELIRGRHYQLTQGFHAESKPVTFSYSFSTQTWAVSPNDEEAREEAQFITHHLLVENPELKSRIAQTLNGTFSYNYLNGYFETVHNADVGLWFVDYNRLLGDIYADFKSTVRPASPTSSSLNGQTGSPGTVQGRIHVLSPQTTQLEGDEILLCKMTGPEHIAFMQQSCGIITDEGGILSHAAIVAREMKKPCLVGTKTATQFFKHGEMIELNAHEGWVRRLG